VVVLSVSRPACFPSPRPLVRLLPHDLLCLVRHRHDLVCLVRHRHDLVCLVRHRQRQHELILRQRVRLVS